MPDPAATIARIEHVIHRHGGGAPAVARTATNERWLLKLKAAGAGERGLLTEFLGLRIAAEMGIPVPTARPLFLAHDFPWQAGTDEFDDMVQRSGGWNLGVHFIDDAEAIRGDELDRLPAGFLNQIAQVDAALINVDRTRANPNILRDRRGCYWAIDFGACLFLNRLLAGVAKPPPALPPNHFLHGMAATDARISADAIDAVVAEAPSEWLGGATHAHLVSRLRGYLA